MWDIYLFQKMYWREIVYFSKKAMSNTAFTWALLSHDTSIVANDKSMHVGNALISPVIDRFMYYEEEIK